MAADIEGHVAASCPWPALPPPRWISLVTLETHPCAYLPGRVARNRALWAQDMSAEIYHELMNAGFRRSGRLVYQPICAGCRACQPIRVPVDALIASKSQRRAWRKNADLIVTVGGPHPTAEKFDLYRRYLAGRHERETDQTPQDFIRFLYDSPVDTLEFTYRLPATSSGAAGALTGVGICDVCAGRSL